MSHRDINLLFRLEVGCLKTGMCLLRAPYREWWNYLVQKTYAQTVPTVKPPRLNSALTDDLRDTAPRHRFCQPLTITRARPTLSLCSRSSYAFIVSGPRRYTNALRCLLKADLFFHSRLQQVVPCKSMYAEILQSYKLNRQLTLIIITRYTYFNIKCS